MSPMPHALPLTLATAGWIVTITAIAWALLRARRECRERPLQQHAWLGAIVAVALLWSLPVQAPAGPGVGLLGSALFALLFGRALAMLGLTAAAALTTLLAGGSWLELGAACVMLALLPAWLATALQRRIEHWLPHNLFVFIIGNGLFVTLATTIAVSLTTQALFALMQPMQHMPADRLAFALLLAWGEALLSGMLFSALVIFAPHAVRTYDVDLYLPLHRSAS